MSRYSRLVVRFTIINAPDWVRLPPLVTVRFPLTVEAARFSALVSFSVTLLPLVMPTVLKLLAALVRMMLFPAPAVRVVVPAAVTVAVCVIGPLAVIVRAPVEVDSPALALTVPIVTALACCQAMFPPVKLTVLKVFPGFVSVMLPRVPAGAPEIRRRQPLARIESDWRALRQMIGVDAMVPVKAGAAVVTLTVPKKLPPHSTASRRQVKRRPRKGRVRPGQIDRDVAGRRQGQRVEVRIRRQHKRRPGPAIEGLGSAYPGSGPAD